MVSCGDEIANGLSSNNQIITEITAYANGGAQTKTGIEDNESGGKNVVWKSGNAISLFFNSGNNGGSKFTTTNSGAVATFTGSISAVSGDLSGSGGSAYFWAVYPYTSDASCSGNAITTSLPRYQSAYAGDISDDLLITVGRSPNLAIYFRNACTVIEFTLTNDSIKKISFSGNNNEKIAGLFRASFDDNADVVSTPTTGNNVTTIEVSPAEDQVFSAGTKYYLVLLPGRFSNGYTLTFTRIDGFTATYVSSADITLNAGTFYTMYNKDNGLVFKDSSSNSEPVPNAVDLGLSVKWASFNLGASMPKDSGKFYCWGGLAATLIGGSDRFVTGYVNNKEQYRRYNTQSTYGPVDNKTVLEPSDDVAHVKLGGTWRMPTSEEWQELIDNCTWKSGGSSSTEYYLIATSKINGRKLYLPIICYTQPGGAPHFGGAYYWTSSLYAEVPTAAYCATINLSSLGDVKKIDQLPRDYGMQIRPVKP